MSEKRDDKATRRDFFRTGLVGAGAAGALAVAKVSGVAAGEAPESGAAGYRETEHVKTVYKLARF